MNTTTTTIAMRIEELVGQITKLSFEGLEDWVFRFRATTSKGFTIVFLVGKSRDPYTVYRYDPNGGWPEHVSSAVHFLEVHKDGSFDDSMFKNLSELGDDELNYIS